MYKQGRYRRRYLRQLNRRRNNGLHSSKSGRLWRNIGSLLLPRCSHLSIMISLSSFLKSNFLFDSYRMIEESPSFDMIKCSSRKFCIEIKAFHCLQTFRSLHNLLAGILMMISVTISSGRKFSTTYCYIYIGWEQYKFDIRKFQCKWNFIKLLVIFNSGRI